MTEGRAGFVEALGFPPDPFQVRALDALDRGHSVLVAAPTGSGKTVVAEYAIARALPAGGKTFYTTPLKALSNQKYGDLVQVYGAAQVGLLTGDNAINGSAPIVVMTTEVLRNMIYAASPTLRGLRYVVLDEVHYLQDAYRGPVWEEVIIHTPPDVDLVCLSATVSNAEEVADWIATVRGETEAVIEERRPVELQQLYMVGDRSSDQLHLLPTFVDGRPNPEAARLDSRAARTPGPPGRVRGKLYTPRRVEIVERLNAEGMLPAIVFIFSRNACSDAAQQCVDHGLRLTTPEERRMIRAIVEAKVEPLSDADLRVLDFGRWLHGLENGFAAHHAGMVPPFKEAVEACFATGLVKVVFATETLSLGINMPARSVVIEKLTKYSGDGHRFLTPGQYTQLTGRAGRRGIDPVGYAVTLWSPFVPFDQVAGLASTRTYALTSSFRPTYNMAANLVRRYRAETAHHLLNLSLAQYQADRQVVRLEAQLERSRVLLAEARNAATCERGDVASWASARRVAERARAERGATPGQIAEALGRFKPGDVLMLPGGRPGGPAAVLSTSWRRANDLRVRVLTPSRSRLLLSPKDFRDPPHKIGHIDLPQPYAPNSQSFQREVAARLHKARLSDLSGNGKPNGGRIRSASDRGDDDPVASCPDAQAHLRAFDRAERLEREVERLERRIRGRTESLARQFDRVLRVLGAWGYVDGWALTEAGDQLARVYHEADLLVAECLRSGVFEGLGPAEAASLASVFVYEARGPNPGPAPPFPTTRLRGRWADVERVTHELHQAEEEAGLPLTRPPDPGFVAIAHAWAAGHELEDVLEDEEVSGGDFVRVVKQLIDLLRQLGDVATEPATASAFRTAADEVFRGVVAASSVVGTGSASAT
jgi:ATP-dependent RNA helicase HelY